MDTMKSLHWFVRAVELGSLSAVAREAATTQPTVSKAIAALERDLGIRLLARTTASLAPTTEGQRFYERARGVLAEFDAAVADARGGTASMHGLLRLNAPVALGQFRLNALVHEFLDTHPGVEIELILNDRMADLVEEGVDVALRLGGALPADAVARHVADSPRWLVAAPGYLERRPAPATPAALADHDYVRFAWLATGNDVTLNDGTRTVSVRTAGRYRVNNALAIRDSLAAGAGIGLCPAWLVDDLLAAGRLRRVLPAWQGEPQALHLLYPGRRYQPVRARALVGFLADRLATLPGFVAPSLP
ncbi:LysR family transcriptional regulator [Pseudoduganella plicata]|uniref:LysR family transcriptional regulator n=1 Tax=Pseudoduganella plicata TaxID=321984 RepID=A0A4P7BHJ1_9BURK|nr:LysR family transcriptional regulator [Pseudoduganella plicata]QBQ38301.1 LysR family transcriptional regulator [Pseudoduganella plicata]GGY81008.1 LysR family transcriptional regulator [Pseudoduganella plicata]